LWLGLRGKKGREKGFRGMVRCAHQLNEKDGIAGRCDDSRAIWDDKGGGGVDCCGQELPTTTRKTGGENEGAPKSKEKQLRNKGG